MMEAAGSSETWVNIYNTTKRYISADSNVHRNYCENIKSHIMIHDEHKYSSAPVPAGNTFQDLLWLGETADNTEHYI
jgi:hypothetical protein